ncbi:MAG: hypothetical protein V7K32_13590 [Nostoc sp.]
MTSPEPQTDYGDKTPQTSFEPPSGKRRWLWFLVGLLLLGGGLWLTKIKLD